MQPSLGNQWKPYVKKGQALRTFTSLICLEIEPSMKISKKDVLDTAELARLEFDEETLSKFTRQLGDILMHIEDLAELDTENVEPTSHVLELSTPLRRDEVNQTITAEQSLRNAPGEEDGFFTVPKVIESHE